MRVLLVGAGGVGGSIALIAARRDFFEAMVVADYDAAGPPRSPPPPVTRGSLPARVDASDSAAGRRAARRAPLRRPDERHRPAVRHAAVPGRAGRRRQLPGHGDVAVQAAPDRAVRADRGASSATSSSRWPTNGTAAGQLALVGMGIEPGMADVFARYAADELFSEIEELGVRDGANLTVAGYDFAPSFSIWTTIEECLNPPVIYEKERGWFTTRAVQRARGLRLPRRHRPGGMRERRARGGAADAALDRRRPGHLQVRARRGVHHRAAGAAQARPGQHRRRCRSAASRSRRGTWWPPCCPTRRSSATG